MEGVIERDDIEVNFSYYKIK